MRRQREIEGPTRQSTRYKSLCMDTFHFLMTLMTGRGGHLHKCKCVSPWLVNGTLPSPPNTEGFLLVVKPEGFLLVMKTGDTQNTQAGDTPKSDNTPECNLPLVLIR